jgi:NAD(P)-dependent dehydrogenase (short-subunit alcohol dehydrogenase family)
VTVKRAEDKYVAAKRQSRGCDRRSLGDRKGTAILFVREGARVVGGDINSDGGTATIEGIRSEGNEAIFLPTDVDEIARAILFLASDESCIITGTALVADAGLNCFK